MAGTLYLASLSTSGKPPKNAEAAAAPDRFQLLGSWALSGNETLRMVHVPDSPTGLRCLIYSSEGTRQAALYCDDDLPRGAKPASN